MLRRPRPAGGHPGLHWLLVAALLLRGLVPVGYMPAQVDGELGMVFCDAHGASTELVVPAPASEVVHGGVPCLFGFAVGMAAAPVIPLALAAPSTRNTGFAPIRSAFRAQSVSPDHRARAPPPLLI